MRALRDDLPVVLSFYSRYPVGGLRPGRRLADAAWTVPLAGALVALPAAVILLSLAALGAPMVGAVAAVTALVITTGALHEDGLADCADGFWGGSDVESRLAIMRDSRLGSFGALALILAVTLKLSLLSVAIDAPAFAAALILAGAIAGRTVALFPWVGLPAARAGGLASSMGRPSGGTFRLAAAIGIVLTFVIVGYFSPGAAVFGAIGAVLAAKLAATIADAKIGGHTGDVIGATVVLADLAFIGGATIWRTATGSL